MEAALSACGRVVVEQEVAVLVARSELARASRQMARGCGCHLSGVGPGGTGRRGEHWPLTAAWELWFSRRVKVASEHDGQVAAALVAWVLPGAGMPPPSLRQLRSAPSPRLIR